MTQKTSFFNVMHNYWSYRYVAPPVYTLPWFCYWLWLWKSCPSLNVWIGHYQSAGLLRPNRYQMRTRKALKNPAIDRVPDSQVCMVANNVAFYSEGPPTLAEAFVTAFLFMRLKAIYVYLPSEPDTSLSRQQFAVMPKQLCVMQQ